MTKQESTDLWHRRLGHSGNKSISKFSSAKNSLHNNCVSCKLGKSHKLPIKDVEHTFNSPLDLIHIDVWKSPIQSNLGFVYYVCFVDDFSRFTWIYPMKHKDEVSNNFMNFQNLVENLFDRKIKRVQSDGGREFDNKILTNHFLDHGIYFCKSCPGTPQQNRVAERKHRHIIEMARTYLIDANLPAQHWVDASYTAVYTINRLPTPVLQGLSPFEKLFGKPPDYSMLRVFRCECFPHITINPPHKLAPRSIRCVFIGYAAYYKGYRCLDPLTGRVYTSRHVRFHDSVFPFRQPDLASIRPVPRETSPTLLTDGLSPTTTVPVTPPEMVQ